jgi:hypothetical protein
VIQQGWDAAKPVSSSYVYSAGWRIGAHVRLPDSQSDLSEVDMNGDGIVDLVGIGGTAMIVSLGNGDGTFEPVKEWSKEFATDTGWTASHVRLFADINNDKKGDVVGFWNDGVYVGLGSQDRNGLEAKKKVLSGFGAGWVKDRHPRTLADVNGDGYLDIVGFHDDGVHVAINNHDGTFEDPSRWINAFGYAAAWTASYPRAVIDVDNDGAADIVGFGSKGTVVALSNKEGAFVYAPESPTMFGSGWSVDKHVRTFGDMNGDGYVDIVGFGDDGVHVAINRHNGTFFAPTRWLAGFGYNAGGWRVASHPRFVTDVNNDGKADVVGFANAGVWVATSTGTSLKDAGVVISAFGASQGFAVDKHPRAVVDLTGDGVPELLGFGNDAVTVAIGWATTINPWIHNWEKRNPATGTLTSFAYVSGWRVDRHPRFPV